MREVSIIATDQMGRNPELRDHEVANGEKL
jgi:hypothetical protein